MLGLFWVTKKNRGFFLGCEKGTLRDFFGYAKKSSDFFGSTTNFEVVIFLGIKYKPLSDSPPPPSLKFVSGVPGCTPQGSVV